MPRVMKEECTVLTSGRAFAVRWTRVIMQGFIVTPTRPMPIMKTRAGAVTSAKTAKPARKTMLRPSPTSCVTTLCRSARRPTTVLPTTVAAP